MLSTGCCGLCCRPCLGQRGRRLRAKLPNRRMIKIYLILLFSMFVHNFSVIMLFPYLPFMVEFLIPRLQEDEKAVGNYIGYIAGSMFIGRVVGSYFWGVLSDRKGRKPVFVASSVIMALSVLAFGFSVNFPMAVVLRFLMGCANGVLTTAKAVASEVSDDSNQALGLAFLGSGFGLGYVFGPAVAGAIADPIGQYNLTITNPFLHGFLTKFPFSLPPIVSCLLFVLTALGALFFLPETLGVKRSRKRSEVNRIELETFRSQLGPTDSGGGHQDNIQTSMFEEEGDTDETKLLGEGEGSEDSGSRLGSLFISNPVAGGMALGGPGVSFGEEEQVVMGEREEERQRERQEVEGEREGAEGERNEEGLEQSEGGELMKRNGVEGVKEWHRNEMEGEEGKELSRSKWSSCLSGVVSTVKTLLLDLRLFLCDGTSLNTLLIFCVFSFGVVSYNEIFSLWAFTQPHLGGLGFSLYEIGICLTIVGVLLLPVSLIAFPLLEKRLQVIKTYYLVGISETFLILMLPHVHYLVTNRAILWCVLVAMSFLINCFFMVGFSSTFMFINNSVTFDKLGSINGVSMVTSSIIRAFAPVICGSLFSASLSDATLAFGFPVNYNLVFVFLSCIFMTTVFMVACLPLSINKQKIIEDL